MADARTRRSLIAAALAHLALAAWVPARAVRSEQRPELEGPAVDVEVVELDPSPPTQPADDGEGLGTNRRTPEASRSRSPVLPVARQAQRSAAPAPLPPAAAPSSLAVAQAPETIVTGTTALDVDLALPSGAGDPLDRVLSELGPAAYGTGNADGDGTGRGGRAYDLSSPARLGGPVRWPWPHEADALPIDRAIVSLRVDVDAGGRAIAVHVLDDPDGFGRAASVDAMSHVYVPRRDSRGRPAPGSTLPFLVRFDRSTSLATLGGLR